jgi:hypothetical protein
MEFRHAVSLSVLNAVEMGKVNICILLWHKVQPFCKSEVESKSEVEKSDLHIQRQSPKFTSFERFEIFGCDLISPAMRFAWRWNPLKAQSMEWEVGRGLGGLTACQARSRGPSKGRYRTK